MSAQPQTDVFAEVVNDLFQELHTLPYSTATIHRLLINNVTSPVIAEIQNLSLSKLDTSQVAALLPVFANMAGLTSLALPDCKPSPAQLRFLFTECPALSKLQSLDLSEASEVMSEDLLALAHSTTLTHLTTLNLTRCKVTTSHTPAAVSLQDMRKKLGADSSGLLALLSSPVVAHLTHLNLAYAKLDDSQIYTALVTSPHLANLVSLDLTMTMPKADAIAALAAPTTATLTKLTQLTLAYNFLRDDLIAQLFAPPSLLGQNLQVLDLSGVDMTVTSLPVLLNAAPHLTDLRLSGNENLGPAGAVFIATHMPNLTKLDLSFCKILSRGYAALAASTALVNLRELNLGWNRVEPSSVVALVTSPVMANLTDLHLAHTHEGPAALTALAQSPEMAKLRRLDFYGNEAGDSGVLALAQSATLTNLTSLHLGYNDIGPEGISALCTSPVVSKLTSLRLENNGAIGNAAAVALVAPSSTLYSLLELNLSNINMDNEAVLQLLTTPQLDQLDVLMVHDNATTSSTQAVYRARFNGSI